MTAFAKNNADNEDSEPNPDDFVHSDLSLLKKHIGQLIQFTVSYRENLCMGNLEEGEDNRIKEISSKVFNYVLLNILTTNQIESSERKNMYLLSSIEGNNVLVPFRYEIVPYLSLKRACTTLINNIECIIVNNDNQKITSTKKIIPYMLGIEPLYDGTLKVIANDEYTEEDAKILQTGPKLAKYSCKYNEDKHIITGNIENIVKNLTLLW